jgi:hypothetical protein
MRESYLETPKEAPIQSGLERDRLQAVGKWSFLMCGFSR